VSLEGDATAMNSGFILSLGDQWIRRDRRLWISLVILCVIGAAAATRRIVALGSASPAGTSEFAGLDAHFAHKARRTLLHIVPSLLFVLLVPLQFVRSLRRRYPRFHRWTGRLIMGLGVVMGISALWLSARPRRWRRRGDGNHTLRFPFFALPGPGMGAHSERASRTSP
jgi:Predicted membrane protein (DUF2306)